MQRASLRSSVWVRPLPRSAHLSIDSRYNEGQLHWSELSEAVSVWYRFLRARVEAWCARGATVVVCVRSHVACCYLARTTASGSALSRDRDPLSLLNLRAIWLHAPVWSVVYIGLDVTLNWLIPSTPSIWRECGLSHLLIVLLFTLYYFL